VAGRGSWTVDAMSMVDGLVTKTADDVNLPQWRVQQFYLMIVNYTEK